MKKRMKDKLSFVTEDKFRSYFKDKTENQLFKEKVEKKIGSDKVNMIKYLNTKSNLSHQFLNKLSEFNENKMSRVNKIAQKVFDNDEKNLLFKKIVKEKIDLKKRKDLTEFKDEFDELDNYLVKNK